MRNDDNTLDAWTRLATWIDGMPVAMMTTLDADGSLTSRPMWRLDTPETGALWFMADARSAKMQHLGAINISFSDAANARFVSLSGHAEIDTDRARFDRLRTPQAAAWFPAGMGSADQVLLKFTPSAADHWDTPSVAIIDVQPAETATPA
jgi:general stress protein 26